MNWRIVRTVARRDLLEVSRNKAVLIPSVVVPVIFVVFMPMLLIFVMGYAPMPEAKLAESLSMIERFLPRSLAAQLAGLTPRQLLVWVMVGYLMAPMFLVLPMMLASIVGADSFAGEKERKTLEALLYTPATDQELFVGKTLASVLPALALSWLSFLLYVGVINAASWPLMGRSWFPTPQWWPLIFWVTPAVATLGMAVAVLVSARVSTFMEANQIGGVLVILVVALIAGQATGVLFLGVGMALIVGAVCWLLAIGFIQLAVRQFSRSELITRL